MTTITKGTAQSPNTAKINALGGTQLASSGGYVAGPPVVAVAGSSDCVATLYDGTSASGQPLATFSMAAVGPLMMPNSGFGTGLYLEMTGTTAATLKIVFTGEAP